jgi:hypothetical protein
MFKFLATLFCISMTTWLSGCCGGEDTLPPPPIEAVTVVKFAGDGQTIARHTYLYDALQVRVVSEAGEGLPGVTVSFTAAPGSGGFKEGSSVTDQNGETFFRSWLHNEGDQQINATVHGYRPATFVVHVTPSGSDIDGVYLLSYNGVLRDPSRDPTIPIPTSGSVLVGIANGQLFDYYVPRLTTWIVAGSFSSSDGSLVVSFRQSPDTGSTFVGHLNLDELATGGSGTWVGLWRGSLIPDTGGAWTATRL